MKLRNKATDIFVRAFVFVAFVIAMIPLVSILVTTVTRGIARFDAEFFTYSMRGVIGEGGGVLHAIVGTLLITLAAVIISVPIGVLTAVFSVEYAGARTARAIGFFVDVMSGIPSIVAGLFAYAVFAVLIGPGAKLGISGALALALLMIPSVVKSSEEMLRLVPSGLKEAAYALGAPKHRVVYRVVVPNALTGIVTGVLLGIARIIGETAPLLVAAGFTASMNYNLFLDRMQTLPVYIYTQISNQGNPAEAFESRAWAAALVLILIVLILNLFGKFVNTKFGVKK